MTTKVTVVASCDDKTEVVIKVIDTDGTKYNETLQNDESKDFYVYDFRTVSVWEVEK